jgi:glutamate 5-kinase
VTIVVKLGSSLVATERGHVRRGLLAARAAEIAALVRSGERVCVVSSGAIALGLPRLGLTRRPRSMGVLQAASAVGQARLQRAWDAALRREGLEAAQVLLSAADVADRATYLNVRHAFDALLRLGVVPVVNENDTTATDEITFGDNDGLAAQVAVLTRARLLVLLTEVEGVYSAHPSAPEAVLLAGGDEAALAAVEGGSRLGRGGMRSKVAAARLAAAAGIPTAIASGRGEGVLAAVAAGETRGTHFPAATAPGSAFELWLRYGKPASAAIVVDEGAERALVEKGASLLAVGVVRCEGAFAAGDAVELRALDGRLLGKGLASVPAAELAGRARGVEAVHRDKLVVYAGGSVTAPSEADETSAAYLANTPDG